MGLMGQCICEQQNYSPATIPSVADKTHLISAYTLKNGQFGWQDDMDYGLGNFLYKTMVERELTDSICFLMREYGGQHIGKKRFEIIIKLVNDVLINMEAEPNKHGNKPYQIRLPAMMLPHPSSPSSPKHTHRNHFAVKS
jgi:hypothetical protein